MKINVKLEAFEGPMDLLYGLIIKNKIDIYDIPIALITDQYLEYINEMEQYNMDSLSEFLVMAANLISIKSRMLLPKEVDENNEEIDPREELVTRLIEYKKFKNIAFELNEKHKLSGYTYYKDADIDIIDKVRSDVPKEISDILDGADSDMLLNAFYEVLRRQEVKTDKIRSGFNSVKREEFTLEEKKEYINNLIYLNDNINFFGIFKANSSKNEVVVTFLAMLQLIKERKIYISQAKVFDDIIISSYKEVV